jgi:DNA primase catalytic core
MSVHKLTAGSGYDYLTRQVAALDATEKGHTSLASYYTERGETPGVWVGSGLAGIDGLAAGDPVTGEQMQALFGSGHHPLATQRARELDARPGGPGAPAPTEAEYRAATRLGAPFKVYDPDVSPFRVEVADRVAEINRAAGLPADWPVPAEDRARVRTQVATELFLAEHGRPPADARELAALIARHTRPRTTAVAGYDLTFSPVKSVSTLWALADPPVAARIERAHQAAVADALRFLETHALYTRTGTNGVRQVDVRGLVATAFTHRDSRAGDPDLHTHVAVANKVQTLDGRWLSIDGRVLYQANVAASETYNTALEHHLRAALGVRFQARPDPGPRKPPVREIDGVDPELNQRWSARRVSIQARRGHLAADFQRRHGRPPTPVESIQLAQQATLETRDAKHEPRTLAEQRRAWHAQAVEVLGGDREVRAMLDTTLAPDPIPAPASDPEWLDTTAGRVLAAVEQRRSSWQAWHVRAEAQRQVRAANLAVGQADRLVDLLVAEVLDRRSVPLAGPADPVAEPAVLRRTDGASVYTVAGATRYTSARVLAAERRLVATAGRFDGRTVDAAAVDLALLACTANGATLNAGQAGLVRRMATSRARLQLAIAPAGAGKTTALRTLAMAWTEGGGTVIGLAPSAAAAQVLHDQIDASTDTLAKLTWSLDHHDLPPWAEAIGPSTLVLIDEAGMADTLSLDTVVDHVVTRGGSVRLIGDTQQLGAIGAGGVLRDIAASHGAVHLSELLRFTDPAEATATLALRDGHPEAIGYYLDHRRVHVGDLAALTDQVFDAWRADKANGLDSIMLAPTRELVGQLNQRARDHRLTGSGVTGGPKVWLADGNTASPGELVITRANDRRLRVSGTDWVKNGDRWTIRQVHRGGRVTVQHTRTRRTAVLPADYVRDWTELGYATTIHTAQGVSADTMHGLAGGQETRQQLYTMLTRGRRANHLYLQVVGDGDPHQVIRPETSHPPTATDLLQDILARDDAPRSASTVLRDQADPAPRLGAATDRYVDALQVAAQDTTDPANLEALQAAADRVAPGLSKEPAWPPLRAHLLLLAAQGEDPIARLRAAADTGELRTAADRAAVLDWRIDATGMRSARPGPLPWIPAVPSTLRDHQRWGPYLAARAKLVGDLAAQVRERAGTSQAAPVWLPASAARAPADLVADIEVWRAATQVPPADRRPTGPPQLRKAAASWQHHLERRLTGQHAPALREWGPLLERLAPGTHADDFTRLLADRLAAISRAGLDAPRLLQAAAAAGPLPDDHAAAALWWRISRHLSPAVATRIDGDQQLTTSWTPRLTGLLGARHAQAVRASPWWPTLVGAIDHALRRGWRLPDLVRTLPEGADGAGVDPCQALVWRTSILLDPVPLDDTYEPFHEAPPDDISDGVPPPAGAVPLADPDTRPPAPPVDHAEPIGDDVPEVRDPDPDAAVDAGLRLAAIYRGIAAPPEPTGADIERMLRRAIAGEQSPVTPQRIGEINQLALRYYQDQFADSWGRRYLARRFGQDLHDDPRYRPGQAPAGWTRLVNHLRRHRVSDQEMLAAGVATTASTGRLIDRFRDRVVFPIQHHGQILGFIGRRHPDPAHSDNPGPKYLNTPDTVLYHKGAQLYGTSQEPTGDHAVPVLVEGPMDAIAVTLATHGTHLGLAPLGTALTDEQATQLAGLGRQPVVATDADPAGQAAAERAYWLLTPHRLDPGYTRFPDGSDPADLLATRGPQALAQTLAAAQPLGQTLIEERLAHLPIRQARFEAARVLAAQPPARWDTGIRRISQRLYASPTEVRRDLHTHLRAWDTDPRKAAREPLDNITEVRQRLTLAATQPPPDRWAPLAIELDPRLTQQTDWPALAALIEQAHRDGHDIPATARRLIADRPLSHLPAQDLRYRLVASLNITTSEHDTPVTEAPRSPAQAQERLQLPTSMPLPRSRAR